MPEITEQKDVRQIRRYRHVFLDAEGTLYVPRNGRSRWEFWADPTPDEAVRFFELDEGVAEALRKLRAEAETVCLVSLNPEPIIAALLKKFGLCNFFDSILLNGDKGKQIERYLSIRGLRKDEAIMVGDMPTLDLYPAWRAGIDALLVDRSYNKQVRAERIKGVRELPEWLRIADLADRLEKDKVRNTTLDEFLIEAELSQEETKRLIEVPGT